MTAHILVVDDDPICLFALDAYLRSAGFRVSTARSGAEALAMDSADPADLLITDIDMPGINGYSLSLAVRLRRPAIPIILISSIPASERRPVSQGVHLVKPFKGPVLTGVIEHLLAT